METRALTQACRKILFQELSVTIINFGKLAGNVEERQSVTSYFVR